MGIKRKLVKPLNKLLYYFNMELVRPIKPKNIDESKDQSRSHRLSGTQNADLTLGRNRQGEAWFPTMDDWWELTKGDMSFRNISSALLKDFGYIQVITDIRQLRPRTILEFGQGYTMCLLEVCKQLGIEYWAVDNFSGVDYFSETFRKEYETHIQKYDLSHVINGLIGDIENLDSKIPENHFNLICSFSVLEHIQPANISNVLDHCHHLLKPGGCLCGTFDVPVMDTGPAIQFLRILRDHGFDLSITDETEAALFAYKVKHWDRLLLENPTSVMLGYQHEEGEERRYSGHWTTLYFRVYKI